MDEIEKKVCLCYSCKIRPEGYRKIYKLTWDKPITRISEKVISCSLEALNDTHLILTD